jgi:ceramide glucosyltransferase
MSLFIAHVGTALALIAGAYSTCAALLLRRWREMAVAPGPERPAVSILKPLCGAEPHLLEGLRSFACQGHPRLQIGFEMRPTLPSKPSASCSASFPNWMPRSWSIPAFMART